MQDLTLIDQIMARLLEDAIIAYRDSNMATEPEWVDFHNAQCETYLQAYENSLSILAESDIDKDFTDRLILTMRATLKQEMNA